jgi:hypothetical protein
LRRHVTNHPLTSFFFSSHQIRYISDAMENQKLILNASHADKEAQKLRIKKMKADLTTTNFKLGDERERTEYMSTNHQGMLQVIQNPMDARERVEKKALNEALKEAVKRSSLEFGHEKPVYESIMTGQMKREAGPGVDFQKRKDEISEMTNALRKHNFSIGADYSREYNAGQYETDYNSGYGSLPKEAYMMAHNNKDEIQRHIADSRSSHYSLDMAGYRAEYKSASHDSMEKVYKSVLGTDTSQMRKDEQERARVMKANLTKTTFVLGDDTEYI